MSPGAEASAAPVREACDLNLGPRQRQRRLLGGHLGSVVTIVTMVLLVALHARRGYRLLLFVPLALAAIGYLQYAARTCVHLAVRGLRNLDDGDEKLTDFTVRLALRRRAEKLVLASLGAAAVLTLVAYLL